MKRIILFIVVFEFLVLLPLHVYAQISTPGPSSFILAPSGSENLVQGSNFDIKWNTFTNSPTIEIKLEVPNNDNPDRNYVYEIASGVPNNGSYTWTVPNTYGSDYGFKIYIIAPGYLEISNKFGITIPTVTANDQTSFPQSNGLPLTVGRAPDTEVTTFLCGSGSCTHYFKVTKYSDQVDITDIYTLKAEYDPYIISVPAADYTVRYSSGGIGMEGDISPGIYRNVDPHIAYNSYSQVRKISNVATLEQLQKERDLWLEYTVTNFPTTIDDVKLTRGLATGTFTNIMRILLFIFIGFIIYKKNTNDFVKINVYSFAGFFTSILALLSTLTSVYGFLHNADRNVFISRLGEVVGQTTDPIFFYWISAIIFTVMAYTFNKKKRLAGVETNTVLSHLMIVLSICIILGVVGAVIGRYVAFIGFTG